MLVSFTTLKALHSLGAVLKCRRGMVGVLQHLESPAVFCNNSSNHHTRKSILEAIHSSALGSQQLLWQMGKTNMPGDGAHGLESVAIRNNDPCKRGIEIDQSE